MFKLIVSLILAGFAVLFVVQNVPVVEVRFLVWGLQMTLSLLIFLLFAGGIIVGWLMHSYWVTAGNPRGYPKAGATPIITLRKTGRSKAIDPTMFIPIRALAPPDQ